MTKAPVCLQDLRRTLYVKAKAEPSWRFWGLYVHVCKMETLQAAYDMAKKNDGAPGSDGVTFEVIEEQGAAQFLTRIQDELTQRIYPIGRHVIDHQSVHRGAGLAADEWQQQGECVAVADLRVASKVALCHEVLEKEAPNPRP
jgi:hypothetical protein